MAKWWDSDYNPLNIPGQIWSQNFGSQAKARRSAKSTPSSSYQTKTGVTVGTQGMRLPREFESRQAAEEQAGGFLSELDKYFRLPDVDLSGETGGAGLADLLGGILGGGGGGGSTAADRKLAMEQAAATQTAKGILDMINTGSYRKPYDAMRSTLADYLSKAQTGIGDVYGGAEAAVRQAYAENPYAGLTGTATTAEPALQALLESQGASTDPLAQLVAANREAAAQRAAGFTDVARLMGSGFGALGSEALGNVGVQRAQSLSDLLGQSQAFGQGITAQEASALAKLQESLSDAMSKGADIGSLVKRKVDSNKGKGGKKTGGKPRRNLPGTGKGKGGK